MPAEDLEALVHRKSSWTSACHVLVMPGIRRDGLAITNLRSADFGMQDRESSPASCEDLIRSFRSVSEVQA